MENYFISPIAVFPAASKNIFYKENLGLFLFKTCARRKDHLEKVFICEHFLNQRCYFYIINGIFHKIF